MTQDGKSKRRSTWKQERMRFISLRIQRQIIFWLTNRMREDWKERQNTQMEQDETEESGVIVLASADVEGVKEKIEHYKAEKLKSDMAAAAEAGDHDEPGRG